MCARRCRSWRRLWFRRCLRRLFRFRWLSCCWTRSRLWLDVCGFDVLACPGVVLWGVLRSGLAARASATTNTFSFHLFISLLLMVTGLLDLAPRQGRAGPAPHLLPGSCSSGAPAFVVAEGISFTSSVVDSRTTRTSFCTTLGVQERLHSRGGDQTCQ